MTISDEDLAKTIRTVIERSVPMSPVTDAVAQHVARAVRAALAEPATPLALGEAVTILDRDLPEEMGIEVRRFGPALHIDSFSVEDETRHYADVIDLNAAGVRALVEAGRRWLAGQEDA